MGGLDRRRGPRLQIKGQALLRRTGRAAPVTIVDISAHGVGVEGHVTVARRELVELTVELVGNRFELLGIVSFVSDQGHLGMRFGLELYGMAPSKRALWGQAVEKLLSQVLPIEHIGETMLPSADGMRPYHPEIVLRPRSASELKAIWARDLPRGRMFASTKLYLEPGCPVVVSVVHPHTQRKFMLDAQVRRSIDTQGLRGLSLVFTAMSEHTLDAFADYIESEHHVEVDIACERIDEADVEALIRA